jgi:GNAT superfamily N-acetyltransferase
MDLAAACSRNFADAFELLIPHSGSAAGARRRFGAVEAIATGIPIPFYNPVFITEPGATAQDIDAAAKWIRDAGEGVSAQVRVDLLTPAIDHALRDAGLVCDEPPTPGMALDPVPAIPAASVRIENVTRETFDDWHTGIDYGSGFRRTYPVSLVDDPAFRLVVAYADEEPVSGAAAVISAGVVGIYAVGTREEARHRGFGTAVTWAAIAAGVRAGTTTAILQSSPMAETVYRAMGFREVCRYAEYLPPESIGS